MSDRFDNYNRSGPLNGSTPSDLGSPWVASTDASTNGTVLPLGAPFSWTPFYLEASASSADVSAKCSAITSGGIVARYADASNFLLAQVTPTAIYLWRRVGGNFYQVGTTYSGTVSSGDIIKLTCDAANNLAVYQNGVLRVSGNHSAGATNTKHGVVTYSGITLDDFGILDLTAGGATYDVSITEAASASDSAAAFGAWSAAITEAVSASDSVAAAAALAAAISESVTAADVLAATAALQEAVAEAVSAGDSASTGPVVVASITETASPADTITTAAVLLAAVAEAAAAGDAHTAARQLVALLTEPATAADGVAASGAAVHAASLSEVLSLLDALLASPAATATFSAESRARVGAKTVIDVAERIGSRSLLASVDQRLGGRRM